LKPANQSPRASNDDNRPLHRLQNRAGVEITLIGKQMRQVFY
jgi:hypothetical protein